MFMHALRTVLVMALVTGCSKESPSANASAGPTPASNHSVAATAPTGPIDKTCALLTDTEVRGVFPQAASGRRNTDSLPYGIDRCAWEAPTGQIGLEVSRGEAAAFEEELRGQLQGFVDPRIQGAVDRIRFQSVPELGDHAIAVLEKADAKRGIYIDIELLAIQRGHRIAVLTIHDANRDAPLLTLETLETLGRPLAARL